MANSKGARLVPFIRMAWPALIVLLVVMALPLPASAGPCSHSRKSYVVWQGRAFDCSSPSGPKDMGVAITQEQYEVALPAACQEEADVEYWVERTTALGEKWTQPKLRAFLKKEETKGTAQVVQVLSVSTERGREILDQTQKRLSGSDNMTETCLMAQMPTEP